MERPIFQPPGTPVEELDTPALVVDLDVMGSNIQIFHSSFRQSRAEIRPYVAVHQCPQIAYFQIEAGNTPGDGGIAVATLGEAEVFTEAGFRNVLIASQIVTRSKIERLCALAHTNAMSVAVDSAANVEALSQAATASGTEVGILVELDVGLGRCGVAPGADALALAKAVAGAPGLYLEGIMAVPPFPSAAGSDAPDKAAMDAAARQQLQPVLDTRELLEREGLSVPTVSVGGTHNYDVAASLPGITEVQAGSYPLMDYNYCRIRPEFAPAAKVLAGVISRPSLYSAVLDAGHKATGPDQGRAVLEGITGAEATRFSAEHGILELENVPMEALRSGDKAWLVPFNIGLCFNQYDYVRAARGGKLEGYWSIAGRGRFA
jgi:D-serine deaminase-like pyridoxal phosphate-dependent protein